MRPIGFAISVMLLGVGCGAGRPSPVTDGRGVRVDSTVIAEPIDTTDAFTREAMRVASAAAAAVDTIIVRPDSIVLRVGQAVALDDVITIDARDRDGRPVQWFAPFLSTRDRAIAEYGQAGLVGRRPGRTELVIAPLSLDPAQPTQTIEAIVRVIVIR